MNIYTSIDRYAELNSNYECYFFLKYLSHLSYVRSISKIIAEVKFSSYNIPFWKSPPDVEKDIMLKEQIRY